MIRKLFVLLVTNLAVAALVSSSNSWGQNPVPNSPPLPVPHNPMVLPANGTARPPTKAADEPPAASVAPASSPSVAAVSGDYVLSSSDAVEMSVFNEPNLTTQTRISSDGKVQFPLIGEIKIGGLPVREARELVRKRYNADYLVDPQVYLNVISYGERRFTVLGQVNKPGTYDFPGGEHLSVLEGIGLAGGFTRLANEGTVQVKRTGEGREQTLKIDVKRLTASKGKTFELAPGDVINVGESWF